jgi:hypothetical protein
MNGKVRVISISPLFVFVRTGFFKPIYQHLPHDTDAKTADLLEDKERIFKKEETFFENSLT